MMFPLQFLQPLKVMSLVSLNAQPFHQVQDHSVIIPSNLVIAVSLRPEVASNAYLPGIGHRNAGGFIPHSLGNDNVGLHALLLLTFKMNETAHGMQQTTGNGEPQA